MAENERSQRRQIAQDSVARIADGVVNETTILAIPFEDLDSIHEVILETAGELGVDVVVEDRIGDGGLVHVDIWREGAERSGAVGDAIPPSLRMAVEGEGDSI